MNVCGPCGLDFSSIHAFDAHRIGKHGYTNQEGLAMIPPRENGRRCLREDELSAAGFAQNTRGRWGLNAQMDWARQRFSAQPGTSDRQMTTA